MSRYRHTRMGTIAMLLIVVVTLLTGCGTGGENNGLNAVDFGKGTLANCLKASGAAFGVSTADLDFLSQAEAEGTASMFGSTYEEPTGLFVDLWEDGDDPREWLMWVAQPFEDNMSPFEIVESEPSKSYVAYVLRPTPAQRRALVACTR